MGVVWRGPTRWTALTVAAAVGVIPFVGAGPASADEHKQPKLLATGTHWGDRSDDRIALNLAGHNDPKSDPGSLYSITSAIGARALWAYNDAAGKAITGRGVGVALVDSGVSAVPGLNTPGKVVQGPDLSIEANSDLAMDTDTFGHGTHMAGIIATKDPVSLDKSGTPLATDANKQLGVAPDAQLLALKLANTDGSTDVSQVIAALDWVTQHRRDNGMNVRVVNLSFGTDALQPYQVDPLAAAAENAWRHGLVVVVSGGNEGAEAGGLTNPAIDPYVLAVGASDPQDSVAGWKAPTVADFSSRGTLDRHVDLLAPGRSIVSLRDPGSFVDVNNPEGRPLGDTTGRLFRGSGTSQAAAVVSGSAALLLQAFPQLSPDEVKAALVTTADRIPGLDPVAGGAGQVDVFAAAAAVLGATTGWDRSGRILGAHQAFPLAAGTGSLELARGGMSLVDVDTGALLTGELDVQGRPWDGPTWAAAAAAGTSWNGGSWNGATWTGSTWTSTGWARARWSGACWSGARWSDVAWDRARWSRARWSDDSWERARWSGARWS
jgi:serine protease AprX